MTGTPDRVQIRLNPNLAFTLAFKSLRHHRMIAVATILGIALGMCSVSTILIVDHNTAKRDIGQERLTDSISVQRNPLGQQNNTENHPPRIVTLPIERIEFVKAKDHHREQADPFTASVPTQIIDHPITKSTAPKQKGEEDYQTMRLAIRLASLLAFFVGAIIVFYTMRFSVVSRYRGFSLLRCLGEHPSNVALSLMFESFFFGLAGTLLGLVAAYPVARLLLRLGISTTGRSPLPNFSLPTGELSAMALISLAVALLGVISPVRSIYRQQIAEALQPRFVADNLGNNDFRFSGMSWLIPPLLLASYVTIRPFLESWLSVVYFFVFEAAFIVILTLATLWWTRPFLRLCIGLIEFTLRPIIPLETLLTVRRIRLTSHKFVFSITGIILVFSLLNGLHAITRTLKYEIKVWSSEAITPYFFYTRNSNELVDEQQLRQLQRDNRVFLFRLSAKSKGSLPIRLINSDDFNQYRAAIGETPFQPGQVILSKTLASRFQAQAGDFLYLDTASERHPFQIIEISDSVGTFAEDDQYVEIKSFALFSDGNPLFKNNLELTLGEFGVLRSANIRRYHPRFSRRNILSPFYHFKKAGRDLKNWQVLEIDKDFLIFDFILIMTIILACIGIINTLLIQVHSRGRELSVLKTIGINRFQMVRLLLVEGLVIGIVGACLSTILGTALGFVSVSFLDHFTLFDYEFVWSKTAILIISFIAMISCCLSAIYPALTATRISTSESLHYE